MTKRILILVLLILLALPTAGLFYLLYSEQGVKLLVSQLDRLQKISIRVANVSGRLAGPLDIGHFELDHERVHVVIDKLHVDLNPMSLFAGVLEVGELSAGSVDVQVKRSPPNKPETPPQFLPGNMRIRIDQANIGATSFVYVDSTPIEADRLAGRVALSRQSLQVEELQVESADYDAQGTLSLRAGDAIELNFTGDGRYTVPTNVALRGHVEVQGVPTALNFRAQLSAPSAVAAQAKLETTNGVWQIAGTASSPAFALTPWLQKSPFSFQQVALRFTINAQQLSVNGDFTVPEVGRMPLQLAAYGNYGARVLRISNAALTAKNGAALTAAGELRFGEDTVIEAQARWRNLSWPLEANRTNATVGSNAGELTLSGSLPYRFNLQADVDAKAVSTRINAQLTAAGMLTKESLQLSQYRIAALDGTTSGAAELQFAAPQAWSIQLAAKDMNPASLNADFPGRVAIQATAQGRGLNKQATFAAQVSSMTGTLRGKNLSGRGAVDYTAQSWRAKQIQLGLGSTKLSLDGSYGKQLALSGELHTTALQDLDIGDWGLDGQVDLSVRADGPRATPHVMAQISAPELRLGEWQASKLDVSADIDVADKQASEFKAEAGRVTHGEYALDTLHVSGAGRASAHHIALSSGLGTLKDSLISVAIELDGRYINENWSGMLSSAVVTDADKKERAHVTKPMNASLSKTEAQLNELCFEFDQSRGCAHGRWQQQGAWQIVAAISDLPLSLLNSKDPESLRYAGMLQANIDMQADAKKPWEGSANIQLMDASVSYPSVNGRYETLPISTAQLDVKTASDKMQGTLAFKAGDDTSVNASAELTENLELKLLQWPFKGTVQAHSTDAKILPLLFADLDRATGMLDANMQVSGTLAQPRLQGTVQLQNGEADIYQVNLALRELNFLATLDDNRLRLQGQGKAGDGQLNVNGNLAWNQLQPSGNVQIKGENLLVADLPEYRVVASPDLNFNIDGKNIAVVGDILIPSARLQPQNVSGAVQKSIDARLMNDKTYSKQNGVNVVSEIRIRLGDDVQVDALGLQGQLIGNVGTTLKTGETPVGRGELSVNNGRYEAYGQKLSITRGRLIFDASPLDDPGLDIQAERKIEAEDITVGVNVRGVLRAPRLQFYSDPTMSQSQVVSYLLVGKPLDELQGSETSTVKSATNTLALKGGGLLASQLGQRIGLEEVGVETDSNNQSALVLGKFLSPRLFVSYGISLTEAINTLKLRYTISDRWVLKTEAGEAQSADVEFKIER